MRRSKVNSTSLASTAAATIALETLSQHSPSFPQPHRSPHPHPRRNQHQYPHPHQSPHRKCLQLQNLCVSPNLNLIRLFAVVFVIGSQFYCCLSTTTTIAATSTILTTQNSSISNTENNFYFDELNTNKTNSLPAAERADTTSNVSQMPGDTISTSSSHRIPYEPIVLTTTARSKIGADDASSMRTETFNDGTTVRIEGNATAIELQHPKGSQLATAIATAILTATATASTTKSVRSTIKQPNDPTVRTRNHWNLGGGVNVEPERSRTFRSKYHHENHYGPFFEEPSNLIDPGKTLVSAVHLFTEAVLNCRVGMLKDKTVMWVRRTTEKVSLLTVGNVTYSGDPRIRVKFQYPNNWRLLINPTQREDAGIYMCQVSTHPPRVFTTNLTILEPPLRIIDEHERDVGDRYYKSGSTVDLQCQISRNFYLKEYNSIIKSMELAGVVSSANKLKDIHTDVNLISMANQTHSTFSSHELEKDFTDYITWAKDEEPLQALTNRRSSITDKWLNSRISIPDAKLSDTGNYSCSLGRLFTVIIQVQVLTGELPAAVQHNLAQKSVVSYSILYWNLIIIVISFYIFQNHSLRFQNLQQIISA